MFRARAAEMLRRGLKSLDKLNALEETKRLKREKAQALAVKTSSFPSLSFKEPLNLALALALSDFNPNDPY